MDDGPSYLGYIVGVWSYKLWKIGGEDCRFLSYAMMNPHITVIISNIVLMNRCMLYLRKMPWLKSSFMCTCVYMTALIVYIPDQCWRMKSYGGTMYTLSPYWHYSDYSTQVLTWWFSPPTPNHIDLFHSVEWLHPIHKGGASVLTFSCYTQFQSRKSLSNPLLKIDNLADVENCDQFL